MDVVIEPQQRWFRIGARELAEHRDLLFLSVVVEFCRYAFLGAGTVSASHVGLSLLTGAVLLVTGLLAFRRAERTFIDTV